MLRVCCAEIHGMIVIAWPDVGRRRSKHKTYEVAQVLKRAPVFDKALLPGIVASREAQRPRSWTEAASKQVSEAEVKLNAMRELYQQALGSSNLTGSVFDRPRQ